MLNSHLGLALILVILDCVSSMSRNHEIVIRTSLFSHCLCRIYIRIYIYQADFFQISGVSFSFCHYCIEFQICTEFSSDWYSQKYCFWVFCVLELPILNTCYENIIYSCTFMETTSKRRHNRMKGSWIFDLCVPIEHVRDVFCLVVFEVMLGSFGYLHFSRQHNLQNFPSTMIIFQLTVLGCSLWKCT